MSPFHKITFFILLLLAASAHAYPNREAATVSLGLQQATGGMAITEDDRYLIIAYAETLKIVDLAGFALATDQPPALSSDEGTDGDIRGLVYISGDERIYATQADGDLLLFKMSDITSDPTSTTDPIITTDPISTTIASGKELGPIAADTTGNSEILYITNTTDGIIYIYDPIGGGTPTQVNIKAVVPSVSFSITDVLFVEEADELWVATDGGRIFYFAAGGGGAVGTIDIDSINGDDITSLAVHPEGLYVYTLNSSDKTVEVISTSTHLKSTAIDLSENTGLTDIVVVSVDDPDGAVYGFVSGQNGLSIFDTVDNNVIDLGSTDDDDEPLAVSNYGPMAASTDGYIYLSSAAGISLITDNPYISISSVTYVASDGSEAEKLTSGGTFVVTFTSDIAGTYELRVGGAITGTGSLLTDTASATSGTLEAGTAKSVTAAYDTSSSLLAEGDNTLFIFVNDGTHIGRASTAVTVDTPPSGVVIKETGFGNGRVYVKFTRLTASDIDYYSIYLDTVASNVTTTETPVGALDQPTSGDTVTAEADGLTNGTTYYIAVEAVDASGNVGTRVSTLEDGSAASATPEETIGPAGLSGETGCGLVPGRRSGGCAWPVVLCLLIILGVRLELLSLAARLKNSSLTPFVAFLLLIAVPSSAAASSNKLWSTEIKAGFWMPEGANTERFFDKCCNMMYGLEGGLLYKGRYGAELGVGVMSKNGSARGATSGAVSMDRFNLFLLPMETNFAYRADYLKNQIIVPYVKAGFDYVFFRENVKGDVTKGVKTGMHGGGGVQFLISGDEAVDWGVEGVYIVLDARYSWINNFGGKGINLSNQLYSAGLLFEF